MALRSNVHELPAIAAFCREHTMDYFRFDPLLHLRHDGDPRRNEEICAERLSPEEIVALEQGDQERATALEKGCDRLIVPDFAHIQCDHLFHCGAGNKSFVVAYRKSVGAKVERWKIYQLVNRSALVRWYRKVRDLGGLA